MSESKLPDVLYHYTDCGGFKGIIESKKIWATNIRYLNDSTEACLIVSLTKEVIHDFIDRDSRHSVFFEDLLRALSKYEEKVPLNYVASFSESRDQLSQWRAYSKNDGYCLGFGFHNLLSIAVRNGFSLIKCVYLIDEQKRIVTQLIEEIYRVYKDEMDKDPSAIPSLPDVFLSNIRRHGLIMKDEAFKEEQEWRLIPQKIDSIIPKLVSTKTGKEMNFDEKKEMLIDEHTVAYDSKVWKFEYLKEFPIKDLHYRVSKNVLVPYVKIDLRDDGGQFNLAEVVLGPVDKLDLVMDSAELFLRTNDVSILGEIHPSKIPYRPL